MVNVPTNFCVWSISALLLSAGLFFPQLRLYWGRGRGMNRGAKERRQIRMSAQATGALALFCATGALQTSFPDKHSWANIGCGLMAIVLMAYLIWRGLQEKDL